MEHKQWLKFFVLFGVPVIVKTFGSPKNINPDVEEGEHIYPCWTSINCVYRGTEEHKRIEECLNTFTEEDTQIAIDFFDKNIKAADYESKYDVLDKLYCGSNVAFRKLIFAKSTGGCFEMYSVDCSLKYSQTICDRWSKGVDCVLKLLKELNDERKCDIEEFEKTSPSN
ncbi:hypothetical protein NPIL_118401 [Nephila pilipes]|uniref:DUF19 domain-containing protein n=1 Tax=Nephila pilipes TaxID=299642 RepID=A0A8X6P9H8_NEPPI|nr:hypothetical protein NPIL_118401 [Nephila pilipes]